ncbi:MAG: hypothetical protein KDK54_05275 [Leptospiraceae bacterium]|nr:hypothetical protein [Leptospiraceae bacterium]
MESCEYINECRFLNVFPANPEPVKNGWKKMFCNSYLKSKNCKRKSMEVHSNISSDEEITPTGFRLPYQKKAWRE